MNEIKGDLLMVCQSAGRSRGTSVLLQQKKAGSTWNPLD
jgi:predicted aconitase with swiveling domain